MADEKTTKVYARLTRDFPVGQVHRRGGLSLSAGPQPQEAEVTKDQLAALEADPMVELVSKTEAEKWEKRLGEPLAPTSADLKAADDDGAGTGDSGRTYEDDEKELTPESPLKDLQAEAARLGVENPEKLRSKQAAFDAIQEKKAESDDDGAGDEAVTAESLAGLTREELNAKATEAGVEAPESLEDDQAVVDAILAKQTSDEE